MFFCNNGILVEYSRVKFSEKVLKSFHLLKGLHLKIFNLYSSVCIKINILIFQHYFRRTLKHSMTAKSIIFKSIVSQKEKNRFFRIVIFQNSGKIPLKLNTFIFLVSFYVSCNCFWKEHSYTMLIEIVHFFS